MSTVAQSYFNPQPLPSSATLLLPLPLSLPLPQQSSKRNGALPLLKHYSSLSSYPSKKHASFTPLLNKQPNNKNNKLFLNQHSYPHKDKRSPPYITDASVRFMSILNHIKNKQQQQQQDGALPVPGEDPADHKEKNERQKRYYSESFKTEWSDLYGTY